MKKGFVIVRDKEAYLQQAKIVRNRVKRFDASMGLKSNTTFKEVKDAAGNIINYLDVKIAGYLSTFKEQTPADMVGDSVEKGAFAETIAKFRKNPVMLKDHVNSTANLVGKFTTIQEDDKGLYVEGQLSNAPCVTDIRFLVAEGILQTLSMGGFFYYREDGHSIFKVSLYEGSLTPIPANPDANFSVRSLTKEEWHRAQLELAA